MFDSAKIQPYIAFTDLREWMGEAEKLGELTTVLGASWQEEIGLATDVVVPPDDSEAECVLIAMGIEFHLRRNGPRVAELVAESLAIRPDAVALAKRLHATCHWAVLRQMSAPEGIAEGMDAGLGPSARRRLRSAKSET